MTLSDLIKVPGITPPGALLVYAIGYTDLGQLKDKDALDMYDAVIERVALRSTDCRLLSLPGSRNLKKEISNMPEISENDREALSNLADRLSREMFGREKRQALLNALRLAASYSTVGPYERIKGLTAADQEQMVARYLTLAHVAPQDLKTSSPEEIYDHMFSSVDLFPEIAEVLRAALGPSGKE